MTAATCNADGVPFDLDVQTFADSLSPAEFTAWSETLASEGDTAPEKKSA